MPFPSLSSSARLRSLIDELQFADHRLKTDAAFVDGPLLRELRQALDNLRMTAWTANEVQNAREAQKDTQAMTSFLRAERLRRFRHMIDDLSYEMEREGGAWSAASIDDLQESVGLLRERLALLSVRRRGRVAGNAK
jgi:hypothetical protein